MMMITIFSLCLSFLASFSFGQNDVLSVFANSSCSGTPLFQYSQPTTAVCSTSCSALNLLGTPCSCTNGVRVACNTAAPTLLTGPSVAFYGQSGCAGSALASLSLSGASVCVPAVIVQTTMPTLVGFFPKVTSCGSIQFSCTGGQIRVATYGISSVGCSSGTDFTCSTSATSSVALGTTGCISANGGGGAASALIAACGAPPVCFHKDTIITYEGKEHSMKEIEEHRECSIPHMVHTHGVIVTAKCPSGEKTLRLTDGHLLFTQRGLQPASDLKPGEDSLFSNMEETSSCKVVSVAKETETHDYFGLNCIESKVLASGLKSSTFEKLHTIPAFWMQIMGRIFGIKRASAIGDSIASLAHKMNLI